MIIHCPACRELAKVEHALVDSTGERAGIRCSECSVVTWLPASSDPAAERTAERTAAPAAGAALEESPRDAAPPREVDALLARALAALPPENESERPFVEALQALGPRWSDFDAHRALIRRAHGEGAMPALGVRYRRVLQELPADEVAARAQKEILNLAMATLSTMPRVADDDEGRKRTQLLLVAMFVAVLLLVSGAILFQALRGF